MSYLGREIKTLLRHGSVYGLASILSRIIGFLMIPLYTHYLTPGDYGINELVGITIEIAGIVLGLGVAGAVYRFYYEGDDEAQRKLVMSTACIGVPVLSFAVLAALGTQSKFLASLVLEDGSQWKYIVMAFGTLWCNQLVNMVYTYLRLTQASAKYLYLSIAKLVTALSLNIFFIAGLKWGVMGLFVSNLLTAAIFAVITYPLLLKRVGYGFSGAAAKNMLRFSLPIIPANLASLAVNASDRYFIKAFFSIAEAGIYGLGYKLGNVVFYLIRVPFMQIWEPRRYALYRDSAPVDIYAKVATYFVGLMVFAGLGVSVFVHDVIKLISPPDYWASANYVPAIVVCYIIYALDHHVAFGILVEKKTEYWTYVNLSMGAINLGLNFVLIARYGIWGAVLATFLSLLYKVVMLHVIARRFLKIPFEWGRMSGMLASAMFLYGVSRVAHPAGMITALLYDGGMCALFLPLVWFTGLMDQDEKKQARKLVMKYWPGQQKDLPA